MRVEGAGCEVQDVGFRVHGSWFRVQGAGFRVQVDEYEAPWGNHSQALRGKISLIRASPVQTADQKPPWRQLRGKS